MSGSKNYFFLPKSYNAFFGRLFRSRKLTPREIGCYVIAVCQSAALCLSVCLSVSPPICTQLVKTYVSARQTPLLFVLQPLLA